MASYNYVTVSGTFPTLTGTVTFTPPQQVTDVTGTVHVLGPGAFTCTVSGGSFTSPPLLATDNLGLLPAGWDYTATVALAGRNPYTYPVLIPAANGTTATLSSLPVSASGGGNTEGFTNPMTTLGDMITGGAAGTAGRLAGTTAAAKQFLTQTGTGSSSAAPAWGTITTTDLPVISGQFLCAPTQYGPGTAVVFSTASATFSAVSSSNINTGNFTAPPSGNALVTVSNVVCNNSSSQKMWFGVAAHGTSGPMLSNIVSFTDNGGGVSRMYSMQFLVIGLSSGTGYNLDLMYAISGGATLSTIAFGQSGTAPSTASNGAAITMAVQAI